MIASGPTEETPSSLIKRSNLALGSSPSSTAALSKKDTPTSPNQRSNNEQETSSTADVVPSFKKDTPSSLTQRPKKSSSSSPTNTASVSQSFSDLFDLENGPTAEVDAAKDHVSPMTKCSGGAETSPTLAEKMWAEAVGTAMLVHFGCGSVCVAIYTEALVGLGQVTTIWVFGAALALYCTAHTSGGHLNPAVSLAFAIVRPIDFHWRNVGPYWIAQLLGAAFAALVNYLLFSHAIIEFEQNNNITRGTDSIASARGFGAYPTFSPTPAQAFFCEAWGTAMLTFIIFSATNKRNNVPSAAVPALVGVAIGSVIAVIGPLSGGGINPARDLGARLVSLLLGWGSDSMQGAAVTFFAPLLGGPAGAAIADKMFSKKVTWP